MRVWWVDGVGRGGAARGAAARRGAHSAHSSSAGLGASGIRWSSCRRCISDRRRSTCGRPGPARRAVESWSGSRSPLGAGRAGGSSGLQRSLLSQLASRHAATGNGQPTDLAFPPRIPSPPLPTRAHAPTHLCGALLLHLGLCGAQAVGHDAASLLGVDARVLQPGRPDRGWGGQPPSTR